jgi:hypothetical protein
MLWGGLTALQSVHSLGSSDDTVKLCDARVLIICFHYMCSTFLSIMTPNSSTICGCLCSAGTWWHPFLRFHQLTLSLSSQR